MSGDTASLLWQEYRAAHPDGYAYSQFCERYRQWRRRLKPSMRQVHRAGEKLFVDFSGKRPHLVDPTTGEERRGRTLRRRARRERLDLRRGHAQPGSAVVGRRARPACWSTSRAVPAIWVPDNLKSGVTTAQPLRAGDQPHVRRARAALRRGRDSGARRARRPTNRKSR